MQVHLIASPVDSGTNFINNTKTMLNLIFNKTKTIPAVIDFEVYSFNDFHQVGPETDKNSVIGVALELMFA